LIGAERRNLLDDGEPHGIGFARTRVTKRRRRRSRSSRLGLSPFRGNERPTPR
jgi:hypothetical protein